MPTRSCSDWESKIIKVQASASEARGAGGGGQGRQGLWPKPHTVGSGACVHPLRSDSDFPGNNSLLSPRGVTDVTLTAPPKGDAPTARGTCSASKVGKSSGWWVVLHLRLHRTYSMSLSSFCKGLVFSAPSPLLCPQERIEGN